ncbi:MAG TPA: hypothetical protein PK808_04810 [Polymorphobacter sp.]|nr:hypothetical protein [Polymorphobacter sp.]
MFALVNEPASWWPVNFEVPADGGEVAAQSVDLKFARLGALDYKALWGTAYADAQAVGEGKIPPPTASEMATRNRQMFNRCVRGWRNIVDGEGSPLPFADPYIDQLLDVGGFPEAFGLAYLKFWNAVPETILGNSAPSPDGGPATADAAPTAATKATAKPVRRRSSAGAAATKT